MLGNQRKDVFYGKDFVNESWSKMGDILDQEMPVATKSNFNEPIIYSILFLCLGFILGGITYHFQVDRTPLVTEKIVVKNIPSIINKGTSTSISLEPLKTKDQIVESTAPKTTLTTRPDTKIISTNDIVNEEVQPVRITKQTSSLQKKNTELISPVQMTSSSLPNKINDYKAKGIVMIDDQKDEVETPRKRTSYGISLGLNYLAEPFIFGGYTGGIVAEYALSNRFFLQTGLRYSVFSKADLSELDISLPDRSNAIESHLDRLHYVTLPLNISYQPIKYVKLASGMDVSYLAAADSRFGYRKNNQPISWKSTYVPGRELPEQAWNNWDFALTYGLSIQPNEQWGVNFKYSLGLSDFTNDEYFNFKQKDFNNIYQLSFQYFFLGNKYRKH